MKHIQPKTWQKLDSMGVKLEKITHLSSGISANIMEVLVGMFGW